MHESQHDAARDFIADFFAKKKVGDPAERGEQIGPVVNKAQYDKIEGLIARGVAEGAELAVGGPGRPDGLSKGYYVKPTLFANVNNDMDIARTEIFVPVLVLIPYADEAEAVRIANDTPYGLGAYIAGDPVAASRIARQIRAGSVFINAGGLAFDAPFGGYKQSGNGREFGK